MNFSSYVSNVTVVGDPGLIETKIQKQSFKQLLRDLNWRNNEKIHSLWKIKLSLLHQSGKQIIRNGKTFYVEML